MVAQGIWTSGGNFEGEIEQLFPLSQGLMKVPRVFTKSLGLLYRKAKADCENEVLHVNVFLL